MEKNTLISRPPISWGVAWRQLPGQSSCGDVHLVKPLADGVLLAAVDGLGHGVEATAVAKTATGVLERHAGEPLATLVKRCHEALMGTRGVVMTVATLRSSDGQLTWLGVGNVEAALLRADHANVLFERALLRSGIVGYQLPALRPTTEVLAPGDLLIFATDGIGAGFTDAVMRRGSPQQIAERVLKRHFRGIDDALVLVVRYIGFGHEQSSA